MRQHHANGTPTMWATVSALTLLACVVLVLRVVGGLS